MLRIYSFVVDTLKMLGQDPDLARQLRRAASSIALNLAEGHGNEGGHRRQRYLTALGSTREVVACLDVAEALLYLDAVDGDLRDRFDRVGATVYRLAT